MIKYFILFSFFIFILFSNGVSQESKEINYTDENGLKQGLWKENIKEGNLHKVVGHYQDGKKVGKFKVYYINNKLAVLAEYNKGVLNGILKNYYENGELKVEILYSNGKKNGVFKEYWRNGNKKSIKNYCSDVICGNYSEYRIEGSINVKVTVSTKDKEIDNWSIYYKNGKVKLTGQKKGGINIGKWKEYSDKGVLLKVATYELGEIVNEQQFSH